MSDVAFAPPAVSVAGAEELVSRDLSARAAEVAVALAGVVESACEPSDGVEAAAATLRSWAEYAVSSRAAGGSVALSDPPLQRVARGVGLTNEELDIVLLVGLVDEHPAFADVMRLLHPRGEPRTSVMLADRLTAARLDDSASLRRLLTEGAAVRSGLLEVTGDGPAYDRSLVLAEGIWATFQGHDATPAWLSPVSVGSVPAGLERWLEGSPTRAAVQALRSRVCRVLSVVSPNTRIAISRVAALAGAADRTVLAAQLPLADRDGLRRLLLLALARDDVPVVVEATGQDDADGRHGRAYVRPYGPILVCASSPPEELVADVPVLDIPTGPMGHQDRLRAWLGSAQVPEQRAAQYAARYRLDPALTHDVGLDLRSRVELDPGDSLPDDREVAAAVRARVSGRLPLGATLTSPEVDWSRLVLEPEAVAQLTDAAARLRHQSMVLEDWGLGETARAGGGVRLLFTGPPGTGKSLAAEVLATAARTDMLRVDLSRVVSKWLGETEKNLAAMFEAAEHSQAVLFMDEADALFGARTEVSDAHDRYANLETS